MARARLVDPRRRISSILRFSAGGLAGVAAVCATAALAQSADLAAGVQALQRGDNVEAVRLISRAIDSGSLTDAERESAYVQRAQATLATGDAADALNDARKALAINPGDDVAAGVRQRAQIALNSPRPVLNAPQSVPISPPPAGQRDPSQAAAAVALNSDARAKSDQIDAQNAAKAKAYEAAMATYHGDLTQYQADRKAEKDNYAAAQADYQAKLKAAEQKRQADLAAWNARVAACKKGDRSKCEPTAK